MIFNLVVLHVRVCSSLKITLFTLKYLISKTVVNLWRVIKRFVHIANKFIICILLIIIIIFFSRIMSYTLYGKIIYRWLTNYNSSLITRIDYVLFHFTCVITLQLVIHWDSLPFVLANLSHFWAQTSTQVHRISRTCCFEEVTKWETCQIIMLPHVLP